MAFLNKVLGQVENSENKVLENLVFEESKYLMAFNNFERHSSYYFQLSLIFHHQTLRFHNKLLDNINHMQDKIFVNILLHKHLNIDSG